MESYSDFGSTFSVNDVSKAYDIGTCLNIYRRRHYLEFKSQNRDFAATLSYISFPKQYSQDCLSLFDKGDSLVENRSSIEDQFINYLDTNSFSILSDHFYITDIYSETINSQDPVPLFFQHIIGKETITRISATDFTLNSAFKLVNVSLFDSNMQLIETSDILIDYDTAILYNNFNSEWNPLTQKYDYYYIQYTFIQNNQPHVYTELLNNEFVYTQADFEDLDADLNFTDVDAKLYKIEQSDSYFIVTLPRTADYTVKLLNSSAIDILVPENLSFEDSWFVKVSNGSFGARVKGVSHIYDIKDFDLQIWNPEQPYKFVDSEESYVVNETLVKLNEENICDLSVDALAISILIYDKNDAALYAFTNDPALEGTVADNDLEYVLWNPSDKLGIRSIDLNLGLIDLEGVTLLSDYKVISTYYYKEENYEFTIIDFNPLRSPFLTEHGVKIVLFVDPEQESNSLYYLKVVGDVIEESNHPWFEADQFSVTVSDVEYTTLNNLSYSDIFAPYLSTDKDGYFLILGEVSLKKSNSLTDIESADVRIEGGGIKQALLEEAKSFYPEINYYWDLGFFDGIQYPGKASYALYVPVEVLDGAGGSLTQNQVKEIVLKHTACGVYPIVKAYGVDPEITDVVSAANSITVSWRSYSPEYSYNVYYKQSLTDGWTKATSSPIWDDSAGNSYTVTGLLNETTYYIVVIGGIIESDGTWTALNGQPIGPVDDGAIETDNELGTIKVKTHG